MPVDKLQCLAMMMDTARQADATQSRKTEEKNAERTHALEWCWKLSSEILERRQRNDAIVYVYQIQPWVDAVRVYPWFCQSSASFARAPPPPSFRTFSIVGHTKGTRFTLLFRNIIKPYHRVIPDEPSGRYRRRPALGSREALLHANDLAGWRAGLRQGRRASPQVGPAGLRSGQRSESGLQGQEVTRNVQKGAWKCWGIMTTIGEADDKI